MLWTARWPSCHPKQRNAWLRCVDVSDATQMQQVAHDVWATMGAPHLVFNNAGVAAGGLVWENSLDDWNWVLGVNLWGVIHGVRLFTPMMLDAARQDPSYRGHIVNTASMAGLLTPPNMGIYNVSKHAVVSLTETLYQDLHLVTDQISASVLCPYFVPTGISQSHRNRPTQHSSEAPTKSQLIGQAMSDKAVGSGKVSAAEVAHKVFTAVEDDQILHLQPSQGPGQCAAPHGSHRERLTTPRTRLPSVRTLGRACVRRCADSGVVDCQVGAATRDSRFFIDVCIPFLTNSAPN